MFAPVIRKQAVPFCSLCCMLIFVKKQQENGMFFAKESFIYLSITFTIDLFLNLIHHKQFVDKCG